MNTFSTFPFDPRRALWVLGFMAPGLAPFLYGLQWMGAPVWAVAVTPLVLLFGVSPVVDHFIGRDTRNISIEVLLDLENDPFYRRLLHLIVPSYALGLLAACAIATSGQFTPVQWVTFTIGIGFVHSLIVLVAHELGHALAKRDQLMAEFALALIAYGHFRIEHNIGHHKNVATPQDPASSRYNESIYRFALREIPGVLIGAIKTENSRLKRRGHNWLCVQNRLLKSWGATLIIVLILVSLFGVSVLGFYALHCFVAWFSISMANYTAHYGLLRRVVDGKREPCKPEHSWSSSFLFSNLLFFNLQRHADHHANAQRPFQNLAHLENTPELPAGIPGLFCMMLVPPVWFRVMNPLLLQAVEHDMSRVNAIPRNPSRFTQGVGDR
ncbi:Alkane 1-monooxygenase [Thalassovita gelatinovora]|uniref:Alkane 1-monooxygenase n=1 Tax=Thalassovita gelatinovora TaxID=53501 RepID=A0A0P1F972_THAGE|nr:alkane 1-monooxygenase [Thalassovita gelatinovora]QIZ81191.1 alkane 1-monooxygenase [Thalassovita gelatinovora]CUH64739.1 Alkane 1-monooxygenase [Thalassovita gelatinovora]SEP92805.1 alkane 1-monooxygenase [Thalassovita gelatinovora]